MAQCPHCSYYGINQDDTDAHVDFLHKTDGTLDDKTYSVLKETVEYKTYKDLWSELYDAHGTDTDMMGRFREALKSYPDFIVAMGQENYTFVNALIGLSTELTEADKTALKLIIPQDL